MLGSSILRLFCSFRKVQEITFLIPLSSEQTSSKYPQRCNDLMVGGWMISKIISATKD